MQIDELTATPGVFDDVERDIARLVGRASTPNPFYGPCLLGPAFAFDNAVQAARTDNVDRDNGDGRRDVRAPWAAVIARVRF